MNIKSTQILLVTRSFAGTILVLVLFVLMIDGCQRTPEQSTIPILEESPAPHVEAVPPTPIAQAELTKTFHSCPETPTPEPAHLDVLEKPPEPTTPIPSSVPQATIPITPASTTTHPPAVSVEVVEVVEAVTAHHVDRQQRMPTDVSQRFGPSAEHVWAFVKIKNRTEPTHITMVWKHNGRVYSRKTLRVGTSPRWRTWSRINLRGRGPGQWVVEVRSADDQLLKRLPFTVQASSLPVAGG
jgi:hypothetical protein